MSFDEATTVFDDPEYITVVDDEHSDDEERYITIGRSVGDRVLMVANTDRDGTIRIISARAATRAEERFYEQAD